MTWQLLVFLGGLCVIVLTNEHLHLTRWASQPAGRLGRFASCQAQWHSTRYRKLGPMCGPGKQGFYGRLKRKGPSCPRWASGPGLSLGLARLPPHMAEQGPGFAPFPPLHGKVAKLIPHSEYHGLFGACTGDRQHQMRPEGRRTNGTEGILGMLTRSPGLFSEKFTRKALT